MHVTSFEHMHVCTASFLQFALFMHPYTVFMLHSYLNHLHCLCFALLMYSDTFVDVPAMFFYLCLST
ncbi:hypothetical protein BC835DRAFT_1391834, partial [Cytidiella melzeri]